jgi:hypothetical protein
MKDCGPTYENTDELFAGHLAERRHGAGTSPNVDETLMAKKQARTHGPDLLFSVELSGQTAETIAPTAALTA